ncbi:O-antigen ligase family protein [Candidatus Wolfebacteria bacterium]|nr:O-antigen ligase family protein [Candidatus Wolfebacteria bacterium]
MPSQSLFKISKFFLYLVPFSVVIVYQGSIFPFIVGKYAFFRTAVELALIFFVWGWALAPQARTRPTTYDRQPTTKGKETNSFKSLVVGRWSLVSPLAIAVVVFVLTYVLAGFFGVDPSASFWSNFERGEGGFQLLHLLAFFILLILLFREEADWRRMFVISVIAGALLVGYGVFASLKYVDAPTGDIIAGGPWYQTFRDFIGGTLCDRFSGSLGNPAYVGTYMLFALFYSLYLFLASKRKYLRWLWLGAAVLFSVFLFLSQTRGAFLGLGMGILFALVYAVIKGRAVWVRLSSFFAIVLLVGSGVYLFNNPRTVNIVPGCEAKGQLLDTRLDAATFQTRLVLWRQSVEAFKDRPLFGWGPENFSLAIEKHFDSALSASWFDRAHNILFDYLIFGGIIGLVGFLGVFAVFYWEALRGILRSRAAPAGATAGGFADLSLYHQALVFALPIAYLVQGAVLFDVLPTYINFFLFFAFASYALRKDRSRLS